MFKTEYSKIIDARFEIEYDDMPKLVTVLFHEPSFIGICFRHMMSFLIKDTIIEIKIFNKFGVDDIIIQKVLNEVIERLILLFPKSFNITARKNFLLKGGEYVCSKSSDNSITTTVSNGINTKRINNKC